MLASYSACTRLLMPFDLPLGRSNCVCVCVLPRLWRHASTYTLENECPRHSLQTGSGRRHRDVGRSEALGDFSVAVLDYDRRIFFFLIPFFRGG